MLYFSGPAFCRCRRKELYQIMDFEGHASAGSAPKPVRKNHAAPAWASGLRQLYDQVIEEPLPDSFKDLLDKLDQPDR
ncbi:MAG: hypothetical protein DI636_02515 [Pelagerythrobacter marensis]|nr:MAG: hypothetical protein DI636_02515 [Pelagerythrobacter marensis]